MPVYVSSVVKVDRILLALGSPHDPSRPLNVGDQRPRREAINQARNLRRVVAHIQQARAGKDQKLAPIVSTVNDLPLFIVHIAINVDRANPCFVELVHHVSGVFD